MADYKKYINALRKCANDRTLTGHIIVSNLCRDTAILLEKIEQESRWIPVSERLPEINQDVILSLRSLDIEIGFRAGNEPYFYCHGCYIKPQNVLAWQPLPEPYKAESEE